MTTIEKLNEQSIVSNKQKIIEIANILGYQTHIKEKDGVTEIILLSQFANMITTRNTHHTVAKLAYELLDMIVP